MTADLFALIDLWQNILWSGLVVFLRVGAMMFVLPAFGEQTVPVRVRLALGLALTALVLPALSADLPPVPDDLLPALAGLLVEVLTGLIFGLLLRFMVLALQIAGTIAAQSTSLSQIFGGTAGVDPQPAMGHVLVVGGLALLALSGLHIQLVAYILQSYMLVPVGVAMDAQTTVNLGLAAVTGTFALAFRLAMPFLVASLIYNVTLGVINRAMPQLMVSFVGAPAITAGGLILLALIAPMMLGLWLEVFGRVLADPSGGWQ